MNITERMAVAAQQTTGEVRTRGNPTGNNQHQQREEEIGNLPISSQSQRARENDIGARTQRKLDRLARDFPALHELELHYDVTK